MQFGKNYRLYTILLAMLFTTSTLFPDSTNIKIKVEAQNHEELQNKNWIQENPKKTIAAVMVLGTLTGAIIFYKYCKPPIPSSTRVWGAITSNARTLGENVCTLAGNVKSIATQAASSAQQSGWWHATCAAAVAGALGYMNGNVRLIDWIIRDSSRTQQQQNSGGILGLGRVFSWLSSYLGAGNEEEENDNDDDSEEDDDSDASSGRPRLTQSTSLVPHSGGSNIATTMAARLKNYVSNNVPLLSWFTNSGSSAQEKQLSKTTTSPVPALKNDGSAADNNHPTTLKKKKRRMLEKDSSDQESEEDSDAASSQEEPLNSEGDPRQKTKKTSVDPALSRAESILSAAVRWTVGEDRNTQKSEKETSEEKSFSDLGDSGNDLNPDKECDFHKGSTYFKDRYAAEEKSKMEQATEERKKARKARRDKKKRSPQRKLQRNRKKKSPIVINSVENKSSFFQETAAQNRADTANVIKQMKNKGVVFENVEDKSDTDSSSSSSSSNNEYFDAREIRTEKASK